MTAPDAGIGHFQRRSRAQRTGQDADVEPEIFQRDKARRFGARGVEARAGVVSFRGLADNAGIDER